MRNVFVVDYMMTCMVLNSQHGVATSGLLGHSQSQFNNQSFNGYNSFEHRIPLHFTLGLIVMPA